MLDLTPKTLTIQTRECSWSEALEPHGDLPTVTIDEMLAASEGEEPRGRAAARAFVPSVVDSGAASGSFPLYRAPPSLRRWVVPFDEAEAFSAVEMSLRALHVARVVGIVPNGHARIARRVDGNTRDPEASLRARW